MSVTDIVATAIATLVVLVLAHLAVYWVVKTLYPPAPAPALALVAPMPVPVVEPIPTVTFAEPPPPLQDVQRVVVPTYETAAAPEPPREGGERRGPPPAESTSIRGDSRVAPAQS